MMKSIKKLEAWASRNELALPGRIRTVYLKCGKTTCKCQSGKKSDKHGPYNFWDKKVDGKLTSSSVPADKLKTFQKWIMNRKQLEKIIVQIKKESEIVAKKSMKTKKE